VHQLPEDVVGGDVDLLDDQGVVRAGDQRVLDAPALGRPAAVAPDQGDGQHAELGRRLQPGEHGRVVAVDRHPEGDVLGGGQVAELVGVDLGVALAGGDAGQGGHVPGQGDGR
jgi:hypothetical protein